MGGRSRRRGRSELTCRAVSKARRLAEAIPIARLMAVAFRSVIDELHRRLRKRGWQDVRPVYGFVLLSARGEGTTGGDVAELMGATKQAASKLIETMEELDYVRRVADGRDARIKRVVLTPRGRRLLDAVEKIYEEIEAEWAEQIGRQQVEAMRSGLAAVLRAGNGGALPAILTSP
jgi:DNA-binding MarR family transcriptional regulator